MTSVIQAAAKGERKAIHTLFRANRQTVWCIAYGLLLDSDQAAHVTTTVFRDLWREVKLSKIASKEAFTEAAVAKTAEQCAAIILQKNPKAFQLPHNKDFHLPADAAVKTRFESEPEFYLSNLPALQRLIFVLHTIGDWGALRIARVLQFDSAIIRSAMEAEPDNFSQLQNASGRDYYSTYEEILQLFAQWKEENRLPVDADRQISEHMDTLVSPAAEQAKRRKLSMIIFCAVICLALLPFIIQIAQRKAEEKAAEAATTAPVMEEEADDDEEILEEAESTEPTKTYSPSPLDSDIVYYAELEFFDYGTIVIQLDHKAAPITCANFVELAEMGYYDFLTIHSIADGTMIQGGDPTIGGAITSNKCIVGEFAENGYDNPLSHTAGAITLNRSSEYDSGFSSFSILRTDHTDMDGKYAVFGYVIEGMDVLEEICNNVDADENGYISEENQPVIDSLYIREEELDIEDD